MLTPSSLIPIHDDNPTRSFSWLTLLLISLNVLVFLNEPNFGTFALCEGDPVCERSNVRTAAFVCRWGMVPAEITGEPAEERLCSAPGIRTENKSALASVFTSMFLHGGLNHLIGNMLFLWVFGNNIEDTLGKVRFLLFYLLTGVIAGLAHVFANASSDIATIGASGAVAGLLGAYIVLFPRAGITSLLGFFFVRVPAVLVLGLWFASQFFIGSGQQAGGAGVAWMAHVGGFVAGALLIFAFGGPARRSRHMPYGYAA